MEDDLAKLNDELRTKGNSGSGPWLALESNPEIFTDFGHKSLEGIRKMRQKKIGLPSSWAFCDVLGLDDELLELVPPGSVACILLFPCSERIYAARRVQDAALRNGKSHMRRTAAAASASVATEPDLFFLKQVIGFGNACGTIACLHAISNCRAWLSWCPMVSQFGIAKLAENSNETFVSSHESSTPELRGEALLEDSTLRASSDLCAASDSAQTALPEREGPPLDHHFAAFVRSRHNRIIELDGTKRCPIDHGPTSDLRFLHDVAVAVRRHFFEVDPDPIGGKGGLNVVWGVRMMKY
eukprot:s1414_g11.t1